jgi:HSP20 family protein
MYQTHERIMVAAPMPGMEPEDITVSIDGARVTIEGRQRGPHQDDREMLLAEWRIGPYARTLDLIAPVRADLVNVTYDNGVLVLTMPKSAPDHPSTRAEIRLEEIEATRGEYVRHSGRQPRPTTTREHRIDKHKTPHQGPQPADVQDVAPPLK